MVKKRCTKRIKCISNKELQKMKKQQEHEKALRQMRTVYPQCSMQYNSQKLLDKHISGGEQQCQDALSNAMRHADKLLPQKNLPVSGCH